MADNLDEVRRRRQEKLGPLSVEAGGGMSLGEQAKQFLSPSNIAKGLVGLGKDVSRTQLMSTVSGPRALSKFVQGNFDEARDIVREDMPFAHDTVVSFGRTARTLPYSPLITAQLGAGVISNDLADDMEESLGFLPGYKAAADRYEEQPLAALVEDAGNVAIVAGGVGKALGTGASAAQKGATGALLRADAAAVPTTFRMAERQAIVRNITAKRMAGEVVTEADLQAFKVANQASKAGLAAEAPLLAEAAALGAKAERLGSLSQAFYKAADLDPVSQVMRQTGRGVGKAGTYLAENTKVGAAAREAAERTIINPAQRRLSSIKAGADANAEAEIAKTVGPLLAVGQALGADDAGLEKIYLSLSGTGEGSLNTTNALGLRDALDAGTVSREQVATILKEQLPATVRDMESYGLSVDEFVRATDILRGEGPTVADDLAKINAADPEFQKFVSERQSAYESGRGEKSVPTDEELARRASDDPMAPIKEGAVEDYRQNVYEPQRARAEEQVAVSQERLARRQQSLANAEAQVAERAANAVGRVKSAVQRASGLSGASGRAAGRNLAGAQRVLSEGKAAARALERQADALERRADRIAEAANARRMALVDDAAAASDAAAAQADDLITRSKQAPETANNKAQAEFDQLGARAQELRSLADDLEAQLASIDPSLRRFEKLSERINKIRDRADKLDGRARQRFQERTAQGEAAAARLDERATEAAQRSVDMDAAAQERSSSFKSLGQFRQANDAAETARRKADVTEAVAADNAAAREARAAERTEANAARVDDIAETVPDREAARLEKGGKRIGRAEERVAQAERELAAAERNLSRLDSKFEKVKENIENNPKFAPPEARPALQKARRAQTVVREMVRDLVSEGDGLINDIEAARAAGQREIAAELEARVWGLADQAVALQQVGDDMLTTYGAMLDAGVDPRMLAGGIVGAPIEGTRITLGGLGMDRRSSLAREKMRVAGTTPLTIAGQAQAAAREIRTAWSNEMVRQGQSIVAMSTDDVLAAIGRRADTARRIKSGSVAEQLDGAASRIPELRGQALIDEMRIAGYEAWNPDNLFGTETAITVGPDTTWVPKPLMDTMRAYNKEAGGIERLIGQPLDSATNFFKTLALPLSPRWYVGNALGNMLLATVAGGMSPFDLWQYGTQARSMLREQRGGIFDAARGRADGSIGLAQPGTALDPRLAGASNTRELYDFMDNQQPTTNRARLAGRKLVQRGYDINSWVDDWGHAMYYLYAAEKKGMGHEAAMQASLKVMGDMAALSPFERNVVKRALPFYPWMRHVTKLAFSLPVEHPGRVAATLHLANLFSGQYEEDMQDLPPMLEGMYQIDEDSFLKLPNFNPFDEGMFSLLTPKGVLRSLNPVLRVGLAVSTGFDTGTGKFMNSPPGSENTDWYGNRTMGFLSPDQAAYVIARGMIPQVGTIQKMLPGEPRRYATGEPVGYGKEESTPALSALGQYFTGVSVMNVDDLPQQQRARLRRQQKQERSLARYQRGLG